MTAALVCLLFAAYLAATNRWFAWQDGVRFLFGQDVNDYLKLAVAAPSIDYSGSDVAFHKIQRFFPNWLTGMSAIMFGTSPERAFAVLCAITATVTVYIWHRIFVLFKLGFVPYFLFMGLLFLNNYFFRYHAIVPGMYQGLFFLLGLSLFYYGLLSGGNTITCAGMIIGILGRQTMLFALPGLWILAFYSIISASEPKKLFLKSIIPASIVTIAALSIYFLTARHARTVGADSQNVAHITAVFAWTATNTIKNGIFNTIIALLDQTFRAFLPVLVPVLVALIVMTKNILNKSVGIKHPEQHFALWLTVVMMSAQPILAGPEITEKSGSRLGSFSLVPAIVSLCILVRDKNLLHGFVMTTSMMVYSCIALCLYSIHHMYTSIGPGTAQGMLACQLGASLIFLFIIFYGSIPVKNRR